MDCLAPLAPRLSRRSATSPPRPAPEALASAAAVLEPSVAVLVAAPRPLGAVERDERRDEADPCRRQEVAFDGAVPRRALQPLLPLLSLLLAGGVHAQESPPPSPPGAAEPSAAAAVPSSSDGAAPAAKEADDSWVDAGHAFLEQRLFAVVLRLDRFFSDERDTDPERSRSFVRWRSAVRAAEDADQLALTTGVRATIRLPALNNQLRRLRLVLAGATREAIDAPFPRRPAGAGPPEPTAEDDAIGPGDAGLRYFVWDTVAAHVDLGGGVLVERTPGLYSRLRFRWVIPISRVLLTRTVVTGFWRSDVGLGTSATLELQRPIVRSLVVRLASAGTLTEESPGVEWSGELAVLAWFTQRVAAQVAVAVNGATAAEAWATDPATGFAGYVHAPGLDRIRASTRFRRDFYRRWLFFELEPELSWPWNPERRRYYAWGGTFRVEVQVRGKEAPPPVPKPAAPETSPKPRPAESSPATPPTES
jgi:hypothetical protein